ncbi:helix-turn-helix transcriptional regulator [Microbacterium sp. G2-8]|uniref:ArsR/SmtB family transcription factor n=1 Tax=Microbacterium sp. G2-8 TaxID=2842454 RepID=UPI001C8A2CCD|nr:ArsR family transcriptional regulator [Microbacterium sp. G2-8]
MVTTDTLRVLYHPARRRIADHLMAHGAARVGDIASALGMPVGSVSHHLRMLEREELVERAPDLQTDGRTSWWRSARRTISWSVDDFAGDGSHEALARDAERANIQYQVDRLAEWKRHAPRAAEAWRRAAFSLDEVTVATPAELAELGDALVATVRAWSTAIDREDDQRREAVRVFMHAFPMSA